MDILPKVEAEFSSPRSKLRRARKHIAELEAETVSYLNAIKTERRIETLSLEHGGLYRRYHSISAKAFPQQTKEPSVHILKIICPSAEELNLLASDALQNLRQSLDHAVCSCARLSGKTDNGTYFPLIGAGEDLGAAIKDKARKAPESIKDIIRKSEPGGGLLSELHQLGIKDKHALLCNATSLLPRPEAAALRPQTSWIMSGFSEDDWDAAKQEFRVALTGSPEEVNYQFRLAVEVRFNTSGVIATKPAVVALNEIAETIDSIIGEMAIQMSRIAA